MTIAEKNKYKITITLDVIASIVLSWSMNALSSGADICKYSSDGESRVPSDPYNSAFQSGGKILVKQY